MKRWSWVLSMFVLVVASHAQWKPKIAVFNARLEGEIRNRNVYSEPELDQLSSMIRLESYKILVPAADVIQMGVLAEMTRGNIQDCRGEHCLTQYLQSISADFGIQPTLTLDDGKIRLTLDVASSDKRIGTLQEEGPRNDRRRMDLQTKFQRVSVEAAILIQSHLSDIQAPRGDRGRRDDDRRGDDRRDNERRDNDRKDNDRRSESTSMNSVPAIPAKPASIDAASSMALPAKVVPVGATVSIPAGCFQMGQAGGEPDESPERQVCVRAFQLDQAPVTNAEYRACQNSRKCEPPHYLDATCYVLEDYLLKKNLDAKFQDDLLPVVCVDWNQAKTFCEAQGKRLPTESEFEYANRAGTTTAWSCGNDPKCLDDVAWHYSNANFQTHPKGQKRPNAWGLSDMTGNVWQWTSDWYEPRDPEVGAQRVARGGSWFNAPLFLRAATRASYDPNRRMSFLGFRCAQ